MKNPAFLTFKREIETLMEATEVVTFRFSSDEHGARAPVQIHATDSLWVFQSVVSLSPACFHSAAAETTVGDTNVSVGLRKLHEFLRVSKHPSNFTLTPTPGGQSIAVSNGNERCLLEAVVEHPASPLPERPTYEAWSNFAVHPTEFNNVILDMSVGMSTVSVEVRPGGDVCFRSEFDTGVIEFVSHNTDTNNAIRVCQAPSSTAHTSGQHLAKFLKVVACMATSASEVHVYVEHGGRVVVSVRDDLYSESLFALTPYGGPRGQAVPEGYTSFSLRCT